MLRCTHCLSGNHGCVQACLRAAGFGRVCVVERSAGAESAAKRGAGVGLDDATVAILKGLGAGLEVLCAELIF